jgi:hypothetical protein
MDTIADFFLVRNFDPEHCLAVMFKYKSFTFRLCTFTVTGNKSTLSQTKKRSFTRTKSENVIGPSRKVVVHVAKPQQILNMYDGVSKTFWTEFLTK